MLARTPAASDVFAGNRASGRVAFAVAADSGESRRRWVHEAGSLRVRFPNASSKTTLDAVLVNTAGGMTGGDRFDIDVSVGAGARLTVTTAAAEKVYRSLGPDTSSTLSSMSGLAAHWRGCRRRRFCSIRCGCAVPSKLTSHLTPISFSPRPWYSAARPWAKRCSEGICSTAGGCASAARLLLPRRCASMARSRSFWRVARWPAKPWPLPA